MRKIGRLKLSNIFPGPLFQIFWIRTLYSTVQRNYWTVFLIYICGSVLYVLLFYANSVEQLSNNDIQLNSKDSRNNCSQFLVNVKNILLTKFSQILLISFSFPILIIQQPPCGKFSHIGLMSFRKRCKFVSFWNSLGRFRYK